MHQRSKKVASAQYLLAGLVLATGACKPSSTPEPAETAGSESTEGPVSVACGHDSKLTGGLFGGIEAELNWSEDELECDSMLRPNSEGIRLRFAGDVAGERLSIIVSLPQLQEGIEAVETAANVTLTVEGSGRFFTTPNLNACWAEITTQTPLDGAQHAYLVDGNLLCVSALGELNGESAISIPSLQFTTVADWTSK